MDSNHVATICELVYKGERQISGINIEFLARIVKGFSTLTVFAKSAMLDV